MFPFTLTQKRHRVGSKGGLTKTFANFDWMKVSVGISKTSCSRNLWIWVICDFQFDLYVTSFWILVLRESLCTVYTKSLISMIRWMLLVKLLKLVAEFVKLHLSECFCPWIKKTSIIWHRINKICQWMWHWYIKQI